MSKWVPFESLRAEDSPPESPSRGAWEMHFKRVLPLTVLALLVLFSVVADAGVWIGGPCYRPYYRGGVIIGVPPVVIGGPVYGPPVYAQPVMVVPTPRANNALSHCNIDIFSLVRHILLLLLHCG
jgi:hypothetical protein